MKGHGRLVIRKSGTEPLIRVMAEGRRRGDGRAAGRRHLRSRRRRVIPRILIIAGSDFGGGAGIQADIKTVTMLGGHAMTAVTAITAQNTLGVTAVHPVPAEVILAQIDAVVSDIGVDAVKIGMIGSAFAAEQVAAAARGAQGRAARTADRVRSGDGRDQRRLAGRRCHRRRVRPADGDRDARHAQPPRAQAADPGGGPGRRRAPPGVRRMAARC